MNSRRPDLQGMTDHWCNSGINIIWETNHTQARSKQAAQDETPASHNYLAKNLCLDRSQDRRYLYYFDKLTWKKTSSTSLYLYVNLLFNLFREISDFSRSQLTKRPTTGQFQRIKFYKMLSFNRYIFINYLLHKFNDHCRREDNRIARARKRWWTIIMKKLHSWHSRLAEHMNSKWL